MEDLLLKWMICLTKYPKIFESVLLSSLYMAKCRNPDCNRKADREGWLCKKCYAEEQEGKEVGQNEVWLEAIKKAKKEHVIFIAYFFAVCILFVSYGGFVDKAATASHWYGGLYTAALILAIIVPALLIGLQLLNEREMIKKQ